MSRPAATILALSAAVVVSSAHIGSPDAWYDGPAGPYTVLVHVQAPAVVPGIAIVNVKPADTGIERVTAVVNRFDATGGTPPPDVAAPVPDSPGWYRTRLWVMTAGSNSVTVGVTGTKGTGSVVVPLTAVAGRRLTFDTPFAALLVIVALGLALGLVTLAGAAVRESVLPPGGEADATRRRRAKFAMARVAVVLAIAVVGTGAWWRAEDRSFARNLFRPMTISARVDSSSLAFAITDSTWVRRHDVGWLRERRLPQRGDLIEDHGKLVHLFVIAADGRSAFAHLHPTTRDSVTFASALPPLPAGRYTVFVDIVQSSGFTQTMTTTIDMTGDSSSRVVPGVGDPEDSWTAARPARDARHISLDDGTTVTWLRDESPLVENTEAGLRFSVSPPADDTASLEPYLGMLGHAVVVRDDAKVFIHLHPLGTISVAAQARLTSPAPTIQDPHAAHASRAVDTASIAKRDTLYFPYAFPQAGNYTVWVQFKRAGRILTGSFPAVVMSAAQ